MRTTALLFLFLASACSQPASDGETGAAIAGADALLGAARLPGRLDPGAARRHRARRPRRRDPRAGAALGLPGADGVLLRALPARRAALLQRRGLRLRRAGRRHQRRALVPRRRARLRRSGTRTTATTGASPSSPRRRRRWAGPAIGDRRPIARVSTRPACRSRSPSTSTCASAPASSSTPTSGSPGVTDVAAPHPEWIQAQVQWAKDANAPVTRVARLPGDRRPQRALPLERAVRAARRGRLDHGELRVPLHHRRHSVDGGRAAFGRRLDAGARVHAADAGSGRSTPAVR